MHNITKLWDNIKTERKNITWKYIKHFKKLSKIDTLISQNKQVLYLVCHLLD